MRKAYIMPQFHFVSLCAAALSLLLGASSAQAQTVSAVPAAIKTKYNITTTWYAKYIDANGIAVLGSSAVSNAALLKARKNMLTLMATLPTGAKAKLDAQKVRVVILGPGETASSIPEYNALFGSASDATYWGGFGPTSTLPICAGTQDNLIGNFGNENVFVHEFGHAIAEMALPALDTKFQSELTAAYNNAKAKSLWSNTYAITDIKEYWAEGIQSYFDVNREGTAAGDGTHNLINTRTELKTYDVPLHNLLNRVYGNVALQN
jgi:hypothetical protein